MRGYVDLYLLPVPRKNLKAYRKLATLFGKVIREHGALEYREFAASRAKPPKGVKGVDALLRPRKGEVLVFSVAGFRSKAHRDRVNDAVFKDPRMAKMMSVKPPFDMKRMHLSEFETFVGFTRR